MGEEQAWENPAGTRGANTPSAVTNLTKERLTVTPSVWSIV